MRSINRFVVIGALTILLPGCGQKGALVLPDAQHPHKKIVVGKPPAATAPSNTPPAGAPASAPTPNGATTPAPQSH
jgi:predicted small lipoprotein YifL